LQKSYFFQSPLFCCQRKPSYICYTRYSTILLYSAIPWYSNDKAMVKTKATAGHGQSECMGLLLPVKDALEVLNGKWKLPIIVALSFGPRRFKQIANEVHGITDKMLSKELKDLEMNQLVRRSVYDTFPPTVEYSITEHGQSLKKVINELKDWGVKHRKKITGK
jgi:DNA-binding HxlR family transcriptional regulator